MKNHQSEYQYHPNWSTQFKKNGFVKLDRIVSEQSLTLLSNYYWFLMRNQRFNRFPTSLGKYGDFLTESLLVEYQKMFEEIAGCKLYPNFSFVRLYYHNSNLSKHCDREGCEYAVSVAIDYDADDIWPLHVKDLNGEEHALQLDRGDMVFYKGCELEHWRENFQGKSSLQLFFFYVDANGPMKHYKYDQRARLGDPSPLIKEQ